VETPHNPKMDGLLSTQLLDDGAILDVLNGDFDQLLADHQPENLLADEIVDVVQYSLDFNLIPLEFKAETFEDIQEQEVPHDPDVVFVDDHGYPWTIANMVDFWVGSFEACMHDIKSTKTGEGGWQTAADFLYGCPSNAVMTPERAASLAGLAFTSDTADLLLQSLLPERREYIVNRYY